ncbi:MAG: RluA family pseudouridine synthase [Alphaproteobacteria bacterium]|nr:RluA family pseudouridine synthase [Alphaproteobacteria bacterium]
MAEPRARLLHQDESLLVFDKPAGLAAQGGSGIAESLETQAAAYAKASGKPPRLVHRLDRDTSGVIVLARTKPAAAFLSAAFAERRVRKSYLAVVCAAPAPAAGVIDAPLKKETRNRLDIMRIAAPEAPGALPARTQYETLAAHGGAALVRLQPDTGRMHQLRVHLAHLGSPIAGDGKYGGLLALGGAAVPRLMLHAAALELPHPDGSRVTFSAPPPHDFVTLAAPLGLGAALEIAYGPPASGPHD